MERYGTEIVIDGGVQSVLARAIPPPSAVEPTSFRNSGQKPNNNRGGGGGGGNLIPHPPQPPQASVPNGRPVLSRSARRRRRRNFYKGPPLPPPQPLMEINPLVVATGSSVVGSSSDQQRVVSSVGIFRPPSSGSVAVSGPSLCVPALSGSNLGTVPSHSEGQVHNCEEPVLMAKLMMSEAVVATLKKEIGKLRIENEIMSQRYDMTKTTLGDLMTTAKNLMKAIEILGVLPIYSTEELLGAYWSAFQGANEICRVLEENEGNRSSFSGRASIPEHLLKSIGTLSLLDPKGGFPVPSSASTFTNNEVNNDDDEGCKKDDDKAVREESDGPDAQENAGNVLSSSSPPSPSSVGRTYAEAAKSHLQGEQHAG